MLRVYLFGAPRIERDGQPVPLRRTKPLALLAHLAVEPQPRDRETLLALLWPEFDDASARNNLRRELSLLRSLFDVDVLLADRLQVRWNPHSGVWVDVGAFRGLVTAGLPAAPGQALDAQRIAQLAAAAELYSAEFLAGFSLPDSRAFEEWQFFQRESLHQLYGQALEQLVQAHLAGGAVAEALPYARRWVALDPLHEPAQRTLMRLYAWSGQHGAALRQYQECARVLQGELGAEPEEETRALHEAIRARRLAPARLPSAESAALAAPAVPHPHVTAARTAAPAAPRQHHAAGSANLFVGRDRELELVTQLLVGEQEARLLTLTGPGGIGKTRLALEAAASFGEIFPDGVRVVQLAPVLAPELLPQTVADALGVDESAGRPTASALAEHLRDKRLLLVLDNCEHLIDTCAQLAELLVAACPGVRLLATSREVLGVAAEVTLPLAPLALPAADELPTVPELGRYEAVRLFVARARSALPGFALSEENAQAVAQICRRLDGIPLAIELAAARVRMLRVEQIAERLDDRFALLTGGSRTALPRHQTLRALIDWSYGLIPEPERELLRRLSVFAGGWSLEAAEAVGGAGTLDRLSQLVNKSLVVVDRDGETRYRLLETIRQYARDRLAEVEGEAAARQLHLEYFLALAERAQSELRGPAQVRWLDRLEAEHGNLRAALEWALATDALVALRLATLLLWFWHIRGHKREGRDWLARALARAEELREQPETPAHALARARALSVAGFLAQMQGDYDQAIALREASLALLFAHPKEDTRTLADTLSGLGGLMLDRNDFPRSEWCFEEALALFRAADDTFGVADCLAALGRTAMLRGEYERARELWNERLVLREALGDQDGIADAGAHLGTLSFWQGDAHAARRAFERSLASFEAIGNRWAMAFTRIALGEAMHAAGDPAAAEQFAAAEALGRELRDANIMSHAQYELGNLARSRGDDARATELYEAVRRRMGDAGHTLAVATALCALGDTARHAGDAATAERHYEDALAIGGGAGHAMTNATAQMGLAALACARGEPRRALALAEAALALRRGTGRHWRAWRRESSYRWGMPVFLETLALARVACQDWEPAARIWGATEEWAAAVELVRSPAARTARAAAQAATRAALGERRFLDAWDAGRAMGLDAAVTLALHEAEFVPEAEPAA